MSINDIERKSQYRDTKSDRQNRKNPAALCGFSRKILNGGFSVSGQKASLNFKAGGLVFFIIDECEGVIALQITKLSTIQRQGRVAGVHAATQGPQAQKCGAQGHRGDNQDSQPEQQDYSRPERASRRARSSSVSGAGVAMTRRLAVRHAMTSPATSASAGISQSRAVDHENCGARRMNSP